MTITAKSLTMREHSHMSRQYFAFLLCSILIMENFRLMGIGGHGHRKSILIREHFA
jgi:hypothetical protein